MNKDTNNVNVKTWRHRRVDWDAEIRKTEQIRRRGLLISLLSFAVAAAAIFGAEKLSGVDANLPRNLLSLGCFVLACIVFCSVLKRRVRLKREREKKFAKAKLNEIKKIEEIKEKGEGQ